MLGKTALLKIHSGWSWAKVAGALGLSAQALERRLRRFRNGHPHTASEPAMTDPGHLDHDGRDGAESILRGVVADRTRTLGPECAEVLDARLHTLGAEHPHTLTSRYRQAWVVLRRGDHGEARRLFGALLADLRRTVEDPHSSGDRHPDTLECRTLHARTLRLTGDLDAAAPEGEALVADLARALGEDAIATMRGREELARIAVARGHVVAGLAIHREVLERRRRVLGDDHSDTLRSVEDVENLR